MKIDNGYKMTEVGVIPEDWEVSKLEDYFSYISYGFTNPMPIVEDGIFLITATDISDGEIKYETARFTSEFAYRSLLTSKSKPKKNDILLTKDGSLGRLAIVGDEVICINQSVAVIRPNNKVNPIFLKLLLESSVYQKKMLEDAGGSTIKHIYITVVNMMKVAIPPTIEEQKAISNALSYADELIQSLEKLIAKKRAIKQGAMQELLKPKEGWVVMKLGNVSEFINGRAYSLLEWEDRGTPVIRLQNLTSRSENYYYSNLILPEKQYCNCGDLLFMWSATFGPVIWKGERAIFHYHIWKIQHNPSRLDKTFLYYELGDLTNTLKHSSSSGGTMLHITKEKMESIEISIPQDIEEQKAISSTLSDMDAEITALEAKLEKYKKIKQGMMQNLLTGKIRLV